MNIVFVSNQPYPKGMAGTKRIRLFAENLANNNTVSVIIAGKNNGKNQEQGSANGVRYNFYRFSRAQSFLAYFKVKKIMQRNHQKDQKNVLFLYDGIGLTNFLYIITAKKLKYKIITDVVEDYSLHSENTGILLSALYKINILFEKRTASLADGVVVISNRLKEKFLRLKVAPDKLIMITVSAENCNSTIHEKKDLAEQFTFIYSGSYGNKDGLGFLIQAFKLFSEKNGNVQLILAGKIDQRTLALIRNDKKINYVGLVPDEEYYQFLNSADVLLMTRVNSGYANSGFPFKLGEYLATGNSVIATKVSDVELYLKHKEDALLAEPSDVGSLVSLFDFAYNNKDAVLKIGKNGKEKSKLFFNPVLNSNKLEEFMENICKVSANKKDIF